MNLVSYFELYLEENVLCLRFGTGTASAVRERERNYPCVCCYAVTSRYPGESQIRQGLTAWDDEAHVFIRSEIDPLVDQGVPLKFYGEANALVSLAKEYVTDERKVPARSQWIASTMNDGHVYSINGDDALMSLADAEGQTDIYMELHGSSDEITALLSHDG